MNVKRFTARSPREALQLVRQAFGDDAVVLSTRPCAEGVEMLAMPHETVRQLETFTPGLPARTEPEAAAPAPAQPPLQAQAAQPQGEPAQPDVASMSTLSFQDYVRERMLKRRQAEMGRPVAAVPAAAPAVSARAAAAAVPSASVVPMAAPAPAFAAQLPAMPVRMLAAAAMPRAVPVAEALRPQPATPAPRPALDLAELPDVADLRREQMEVLNELRSMRGIIEQRFDAMAFADQLQRSPAQSALTQRLLDCGFSPALIRKLTQGLPQDVADPLAWAAGVLQRNLRDPEAEVPLEETGGVYALIGSTGVGKTTTTAKLAAACATRHGPGQLGLITLDAYRVGAHEQLRAYGRILGVPVHTAHDRASLEDLLSLLGGKKMVIIDTAGMAQRDERTRELLEMLVHPSIRRLLVVNAAAQAETIDDVMYAWRAAQCHGVILSKLDEAVKLAPALDALIRHRMRVMGVANGQRVPEDWHRLSAQSLVQRALRAGGAGVFRMQADDVNLVFSGAGSAGPAPAMA
ncbi:flagellar biosynthesis protein FlhF [Azohydromonas caseinilytica]|uniref:Flagellar biosynthesis protein FlhF n=1 Tax=Azohydromonas caseinilytica TaxID=2728836 RepID=A0A848F808_9BURK|nr:flagellar biosynthesis protein FlhF [Azohydromonas caseinilytica]NML14896.1 flagellar biosynthesis protein FlhF [Azohydromonas caseinilytica]